MHYVCRFMLKRMMAGREELFVPQRTPEQQAWLQYQQEAFRANFRSQVVEVRGVSKGTRTGGIRRFSAVVVVGNSQVGACTLACEHAPTPRMGGKYFITDPAHLHWR